jgi:hypothetical protein
MLSLSAGQFRDLNGRHALPICSGESVFQRVWLIGFRTSLVAVRGSELQSRVHLRPILQ